MIDRNKGPNGPLLLITTMQNTQTPKKNPPKNSKTSRQPAKELRRKLQLPTEPPSPGLFSPVYAFYPPILRLSQASHLEA